MEEPTYAQRVAAKKQIADAQAWSLRQQGLTYKAIGEIMGVGLTRAKQRVDCHRRKREALTQPEEN